MTEVVNLNRARKSKGRETALRTAAENRVRFGRTGPQKAADRAGAAAARRALDQAKREP